MGEASGEPPTYTFMHIVSMESRTRRSFCGHMGRCSAVAVTATMVRDAVHKSRTRYSYCSSSRVYLVLQVRMRMLQRYMHCPLLGSLRATWYVSCIISRYHAQCSQYRRGPLPVHYKYSILLWYQVPGMYVFTYQAPGTTDKRCYTAVQSTVV